MSSIEIYEDSEVVEEWKKALFEGDIDVMTKHIMDSPFDNLEHTVLFLWSAALQGVDAQKLGEALGVPVSSVAMLTTGIHAAMFPVLQRLAEALQTDGTGAEILRAAKLH